MGLSLPNPSCPVMSPLTLARWIKPSSANLPPTVGLPEEAAICGNEVVNPTRSSFPTTRPIGLISDGNTIRPERRDLARATGIWHTQTVRRSCISKHRFRPRLCFDFIRGKRKRQCIDAYAGTAPSRMIWVRSEIGNVGFFISVSCMI